MRQIIYGIEEDTGLVYSRVNWECAGPVLDFEAIGMGGDGYAPGDFRGPTRFNLEKIPIQYVYPYVKWTKGKTIPLEVKNAHRAFWGFKELK